MRRYFTVFLTVTIFIGITACDLKNTKSLQKESDPNETAKPILHRSKPITNSELAGTYKGNHQLNQFINSAVILNIREDGTYKAQIFANGEEMLENKMSPQLGTYKTYIETEIDKDAYGTIRDTTYFHFVTCMWNSDFGLRSSTYIIHPNNDKLNEIKGPGYRLLPWSRQHFIGYDVVVREVNAK